MIPVHLADPPPDFEEKVGAPGQQVLWELSGDTRALPRRGPKRIHLDDLWTRALPYMRIAYSRRCAYTALHIHSGTGCDSVDHYRPTSHYPELAYTWDNYRYASLNANRIKGNLDVLDPCKVDADWFALRLDTFKIEARVDIPPEEKTRWENTLKILNDPTFCDARRWYFESYFGRNLDGTQLDTRLSLEFLRQQAPFVAAEIQRLAVLPDTHHP